MAVATLVIAVVAVSLSVLSLAWQAAAFLLTGPRVKVTLAEGYRGPNGAMIAPASVYTDGGAAIARMGFTEHVVAVRAVNSGRLPATVNNWTVKFGNRAAYLNPTDPLNPRVPFRLEPHTSQTWYAPVDFLVDVQADFTNQSTRAAKLRGEVELASRDRPV